MVQYGQALATMSIHESINAGMPMVIDFCTMNGAKFAAGSLAKNAATFAWVLDTYIQARIEHLHLTAASVRSSIKSDEAACAILKKAHDAAAAVEAKSPAVATAMTTAKANMGMLAKFASCFFTPKK